MESHVGAKRAGLIFAYILFIFIILVGICGILWTFKVDAGNVISTTAMAGTSFWAWVVVPAYGALLWISICEWRRISKNAGEGSTAAAPASKKETEKPLITDE